MWATNKHIEWLKGGFAMSARIKIAEAFYQAAYASFLEYCSACDYVFLDELTPVDFVAYKTKYDVDPSFVKQLKNDVCNLKSSILLLHLDSESEPVNKVAAVSFTVDRQFNDDNEHIGGLSNSAIEGKNNCGNEDADFTTPNDEVKFTEPTEDVTKTFEPVLDSVHLAPGRVSLCDSIHSLNLSVRSTNALINGGIKTILQLLEVDREVLSQIRNLGVKSINEILAKIGELEAMGFSLDSVYDSNSESIGKIHLSKECRDTIEALLLGKTDYNTLVKLSLEEQVIVENVVNAIDSVGCEILLETYENPSNLVLLISSFQEFIVAYEEEKELLNIYDAIPYYRRHYALCNYIEAFTSNKALDVKEALTPFLNQQSKISDLRNLLREVNKKQNSKTAMFTLLKLLQTDLEQVLIIPFGNVNQKYQRLLSILRKRSKGLSLESIAKEIGLTRERVRQLEKKAINFFIENISKTGIDPLMFICADRGGDTVLTIQEIKDYINDSSNSDLFTYILQKKDVSDLFVYDSTRELFHLKDIEYNADLVIQTVADLPQMIFVEETNSILSSASRQSEIPLEIIKAEFNKRYQISGKVYYRGRLKLSLLYDFILKNYYPAGFKLYDDTEMYRFKEKFTEVFGDDINFPDNSHAFSSRLYEISVLFGRGMCIHPSYIQIPDYLVKKIDDYIFNSERIALSFHELFETFSEELLLYSNIYNRFFLQGVLNYYIKDKYYFTRDFISKEKNANFKGEIEAFIKDRGEVNKVEIFSEFQGITEIMFSMNVSTNSNIISLDNGQYMHSDLLNLRDEDYTIKRIIESEVENFPVSSRKLMEKLWITHADFLTRNNILTHNKLFGILQYMFKGEFTFSRSYLAKLGLDEVSNISVIKQYLKDYDSLSVTELLDICSENHLRFLSVRGLIRQLNDDFLRTNGDFLERIQDNLLTDDALSEIANILWEGISNKGYIVAGKVDNYIYYPDIGFLWNAFLLRSIVEKYFADDIMLIDMPTSDNFTMNTIFVDPALDVDNYEELLISVLKSEHNKEPFLSVDDVLNWLHSEGLILGETPKCLTDGRIFYMDEYGEIIIN